MKIPLDNVKGSFFITDSNANILYANSPTEGKTGFDKAEIVGANPGKLWGKQMPGSFYKNLWNVIAEKRRPFIAPVQNKTKQGETYEETIRLAPVFNGDSIQYFIALNFGASEDKNFDAEFVDVLYKSQKDAQVFQKHLSEWYGTEISESTTEGQPLFEFLQTNFVDPTSEMYHDRREDRELLLQIKDRTDVFSELYIKYYKDIYNYFFRRVDYQKTLTEDLVQETFLRAFAHVSEFTPSNATYKTYLLRVAHNLLVNHYRSSVFMLSTDEAHLYPDRRAHPLIFDFRLEAALQKLSEIEQTVLKLMYQEGYTVREIAGKVTKTENAVKLHLSRARRRLRNILLTP